ncbi:hypothetical protein [Sphingomonas oryzagri]
MDKDPIGEVAGFNFDIARSMIAAMEESWQLPQIWLANWWNVVVDSWPPHDFATRD